MLLYQAWRRCWCCESETELRENNPWRMWNCRVCGYAVDVACALVWREERRKGRDEVEYQGKEVELEGKLSYDGI